MLPNGTAIARPIDDPKVQRDFLVFAEHMVRSEDIDPLYPVLRALYQQYGFKQEQALWATALYLAYYNLPSALQALALWPLYDRPQPAASELHRFPRAVERRGLRAESALAAHLHSLVSEVHTSVDFAAWLRQGWTGQVYANYEVFWETAQRPWGNGRWAAFKWCELLKKVHGFNLAAPDMRMQYCSGPREGLCWLFSLEEPQTVGTLNLAGEHVYHLLHNHGFRSDWEQVETLLCNFNSMRKGNYYCGHDWSEIVEQVASSSLEGRAKQRMLDLIFDTVPDKMYVGPEVDRTKCKMYVESGVVL